MGRARKTRELTAEDLITLVGDYEKGMAPQKILAKYDISKVALYRILRSLGVKTRQKGPARYRQSTIAEARARLNGAAK